MRVNQNMFVIINPITPVIKNNLFLKKIVLHKRVQNTWIDLKNQKVKKKRNIHNKNKLFTENSPLVSIKRSSEVRRTSYLLASDYWIPQICYVLFIFQQKNTNMIPAENKRRLVHPDFSTGLPSPHCGEKVAAGTLRSRRTWCWGGREGKKEAGRGEMKKSSPPLTEAVHRWVGPDRPRAGCISGGLSRLQPEERLALWGFWWSQLLSAKTSGVFTFLIHVSLNICMRLLNWDQNSAGARKNNAINTRLRNFFALRSFSQQD